MGSCLSLFQLTFGTKGALTLIELLARQSQGGHSQPHAARTQVSRVDRYTIGETHYRGNFESNVKEDQLENVLSAEIAWWHQFLLRDDVHVGANGRLSPFVLRD